jgi:hypothetical protein
VRASRVARPRPTTREGRRIRAYVNANYAEARLQVLQILRGTSRASILAGRASRKEFLASEGFATAIYLALWGRATQQPAANLRALARDPKTGKFLTVPYTESNARAVSRLKVGLGAANQSAAAYVQRMGIPVELGGREPGIRQVLKEVRESTVRSARAQILRAIQADIKKATSSAKETSIRYVYGVSKALLEGNVTTGKEFKTLIASVQASLAEAAITEIMQFYARVAKLQTAQELYARFIQEISNVGFKIFIDDSGLIRAVKNIETVLSSLSWWLSEEIDELIYLVLARTFIEAWSGLDKNQMPQEYRDHLLMLIWKHYKMGTIRVNGKKLTNWWITVDFEKLFGSVVDLESAYHLGAMTSARVGGTDKSGGTLVYSRVKLPYVGQPLMHSIPVRYGYWYSMWMGNRMYSPAGAANRKEHISKMKTRMETLQKRQANLAEKRSEYSRTTTDTGIKYAYEEAKFEARKNRLDSLEEYARTYSTKQVMRIPPGQRDLTIATRIAYWAIRGVAPYWYFLEYGQLRYAPTIPPRGVYGRFIINLRREISKLVTKMYNEGNPEKGVTAFARRTGIMVDKQGRRRRSGRPGPGEVEITFTHYRDAKTHRVKPIGQGKAKPGSFLPQSAALISKMTTTARRTVAEAERFGKISTGAQQRIATKETEFNAFLKRVEAWSNPSSIVYPDMMRERQTIGAGPLRAELRGSLAPTPVRYVPVGGMGYTRITKPSTGPLSKPPMNAGLRKIRENRLKKKGVVTNPMGLGPPPTPTP